MTLRLFVLQPTVLFRARVNMGGTITYPLDTLVYDTVTVGAYTDLRAGMTVMLGSAEGLDDYGRTRLRKTPTATDLYVGRSSRGRGDGELDVSDNAFISVLWDYRIWSKTPATVANVWYMDSDIAVGTYTTNPPPVANTGPPALGTIGGTGKLRVQLPASGSNTSFATADGASIASYSWGLPSGCSLVSGYAQTDAVVRIDCDPGFYWISLTVVDSNGQSHVARVWVYARDPDDDATITDFEMEQRITAQGQTARIRVLSDLPERAALAATTSYPDGTLVAVMDGEMSGPTDRSNLLFWGWHQTDPAQIQATRTGLLRETTLDCVDVAGRLDSLPGFGLTLLNDTYRDTGVAAAIDWHHMTTPTMDKYMHYVLHWFSTALEVADWTWSATGATYAFVRLDSLAKSLWDQVAEVADKMGGFYVLTCNRQGAMGVGVEPLHRSPAFRTATIQATLDEDDWAEIRFTAQRPPRVHWLRGAGVVARSTYYDPPDTNYETVFCLAPGEAPGQGEVEQEINELLVVNQDALNNVIGQRYARLNARRGLVSVRLADGDDREIDPAALTWVRLNVTAATNAQRKLLWSNQRGLVRELNIGVEPMRTGLVRTVELVWEEETVGAAAATTVQ